MIELLSKEEKKYFRKVAFRKNDILFHEGETCTEVCYLTKGTCSIVSNGYHGQEIRYNQLSEGQCFGDVLLFSSHPVYLGDVTALTDGECFLISKSGLMSVFAQNQGFLEFFLKGIAEETLSSKKKLRLYVHKNLEDRFLSYLSMQGKKNIPIESVASLARILGFPRENVSRILHQFERSGYLTYENRTIHLVR